LSISRFFTLLEYNFKVLFNDSLDFISICGYVHFFVSDFINLGVFLLPFVMLALGLMILLIFSKNYFLFHFFEQFLCFDLIDLGPDFYYFFPSAVLGLVYFCFPRSLR
jgi:hypothetical protein